VSFAWALLDAAGTETGRSEQFPGREEAETWLGEVWADLLGSGVEEVTLLDLAGDREVYRMGLREG